VVYLLRIDPSMSLAILPLPDCKERTGLQASKVNIKRSEKPDLGLYLQKTLAEHYICKG
jgi:hypothetical protein